MAPWIDRPDHETAVRILESLPFFAVLVDRERHWVWVNRLDPTLTIDDVKGTRVEEFVHPVHREHAVATIEDSFARREVGYYEASAYGEGELTTWYGTTVVPFETADGRELAMLLSSDVTERKRAQADLARSEERLRQVLEQSPDQIAITGPDLRVRYFNKPPPPTSRFTLKDILGSSIPDLTHPDYRAIAVATIRGVLEGGPQSSYVAVGLAQPERHYEVRVQPFPPEDDEPRVLLVTREITDRVKAELLREQLLQSQKMDLLGQMAGGVAHDFNNLLTVILNNAELAQAQLPPGARVADVVGEITKAAGRAADLTRQLLAFSRKQPQDAIPVAVGDLVDSAVRMLERILPETVVLATPVHEQAAAVMRADRAQIEQVLMNLCVNARDAMPEGGRIALRSRVVTLLSHDPRAGSGGAGDYVEIAVRDEGEGMEPATAARVFEPFFTTKPVGRGTGLGMSVALGIVQAHGGAIEVESERGRGTTVFVRLPLASSTDAAREPPPEVTARSARHVLIVDDDAPVRTSLARLLAHEGYAVTSAASGREAIDLVRGGLACDVVVLDVVMPELGGPETYEALRALRPDLPAVFATGYGRSHLSEGLLERGGAEVIDKPYRLETLVAAIERALARRDRPA